MSVDKKQFTINKCLYQDVSFLTSSAVPFPAPKSI